jgi:S-DNA-T family DNA segregation ATPase FtsK/SpoIIIE
VKVGAVSALRDEFAYACAAESVRILAPIPGKTAVGIELPRGDRETVRQSDVPLMGNHVLTVGIGKDVEGRMVTANLNELPHLLIAGTTGSGKSSFINSVICTLLETDPDQVKMLLIDPKMVELTPYDGVAHLLRPVITEVDEAVAALKELCDEMDARFEKMRKAGQRGIDGLGLPYIICVIDELADLMMQSKAIEKPIVRIAQKARAAGIHLIVATQRPTVDVCTGLIKANIPTRLAFACSSVVDSRVILDDAGAEQLLGKGDGLFKAGRDTVRIQGVLVTDEEIAKLVRAARATAAVEAKVHGTLTVDHSQYIDFFDQVIDKADASWQRTEDYFKRLHGKKGFFNRGGKMDEFVNAPKELGEAAASLAEIAEALRFIKSSVVVGV